MAKVKIVIDDEITSELVNLYKESLSDQFIGGTLLTKSEIRKKLTKYQSTTSGSLECLGIMKIYFGDQLVGWSIPRPISVREYPAFKIKDKNKWYRVGTVFITAKQRGKGIMTEVLHQFMDLYQNVIWVSDGNNIASAKTALKCGLKYSHSIYFGENGAWSFKDSPTTKRVDKVYKTS